MTTYTTRTLAEKIMPAAAETNIKGATRTLRKFLRDDLGQGKAVVGKGNRYALDYTAKEITALKKKFADWEIEQAEAQKARRDALAAKVATPAIIEEAPIEGAEIAADAVLDRAETIAREMADHIADQDEVLDIEGPSDDDIATMLAEIDDEN